MPAIPYLVPEFVSVAAKNSVPHSGVHFPLFFLGFAHSRIFRLFRVFRLFRFSRVHIRNSGFSVFSAFSAFSGFQGSKSGIPLFPFFFSAFWGSKPGIPGSRLRPRLVRPRLARPRLARTENETVSFSVLLSIIEKFFFYINRLLNSRQKSSFPSDLMRREI